LKKELREVLPLVESVMKPVFEFGIIREVEVKPNGITLNGSKVLSSEDLAKTLEGSIAVLALAVTLGPGPDELAVRYGDEGRLTAQAITGAAGSAAVERVTTVLQGYLAEAYWDKGFKLTRRFSPGYGDFGLDYQSDVLKLSGGYNIGIKLTENDMMIPLKSVTVLVGIIPDG
jgi:hypothetical protein